MSKITWWTLLLSFFFFFCLKKGVFFWIELLHAGSGGWGSISWGSHVPEASAGPLNLTTICKQVVSSEWKFNLPSLDEAEEFFLFFFLSLFFFFIFFSLPVPCHWWGWTLVDNNAAIVDALWPIKFEGGYSGFGM